MGGPSVLFNCFSSKLLQIKGFLVIFDPLEWTKKKICHFFFLNIRLTHYFGTLFMKIRSKLRKLCFFTFCIFLLYLFIKICELYKNNTLRMVFFFKSLKPYCSSDFHKLGTKIICKS